MSGAAIIHAVIKRRETIFLCLFIRFLCEARAKTLTLFIVFQRSSEPTSIIVALSASMTSLIIPIFANCFEIFSTAKDSHMIMSSIGIC